MSTPKVSVIIPAYNGGDYLGEAIQSVLTQTYPHFELIVVDDASPKDANSLIGQFDDPRLKYIVHQQNQGAVAARKTGVDASSGAIIAFLDQDDLFHPEKLQAHVKFLEEHPAVGVTYNSRMECEGESRTIRSIWHPPDRATLADLVLGFPFAPSDTVLRRELALRDEIWDQSYVSSSNETIFNGAEIILGGRLALEGHQFASVGRALNYRRYHPRRVFSKVAARCSAELTCQQMILDDPRCPDEVRQLRNRAFMNTNLYWSYYAFAQEETALGHSLLREAVRLHPALVEGCPCELVKFFVHDSASDGSVEVKEHLKKLFAQLPPELAALSAQLDWAVGCAYLLRGAQAIMWNRIEEGQRCFAQAIQADAEFDEFFTQNLTRQLLNYQKEFGGNATQKVVERLVSYLHQAGYRNGQWLRSSYAINQAFQQYQSGNYAHVSGQVIRAIKDDPRYLLNRGVLAILLRSMLGGRGQRACQQMPSR